MVWLWFGWLIFMREMILIGIFMVIVIENACLLICYFWWPIVRSGLGRRRSF